MLGRRDEPLPVEAVRDLLGIVRAMYAVGAWRRPALTRIGRDLAAAIDLARHPIGTVGHRAAWKRAERAVEELGELVRMTDQAEPIVRAAVGRVRR